MNVQGNKQPAEEMVNHTTLTVQQPQAPTYNHPCGDLLNDGGKRREYLDNVVPLYTASIEGDLEAAKRILQDRKDLVQYSITKKKETPLHVAAAGQSHEFVRYLVSMMSTVDLELLNGDGNTAFCVAAISGNVDMVEIMVEKNPALPKICGSKNKMPLYLAAFHGNHKMVRFLYEKSRTKGDCLTIDVIDGVLLKCIQAGIFDVALNILKDNGELPQDEHLWDMLQVLAQKSWAFYENRPFPVLRTQENPSLHLPRSGPGPGIVNSILALYPRAILDLFFPINAKKSDATPLLRLLWKRIMEKPTDVIDKMLRGPAVLNECNMETYPSQVLFIAAKMNNTQFLVELIREYPDLIWTRNDDEQTIFHIAISHRHHDICSLLYEIGSLKDLITPMQDKEGNNILHLVGKFTEKNTYEEWVTTPFQMLSEFLWYKEVEGILPPPCREVKNAAGQTPQQLFTEHHKKLVSEGLKSINETINISMVVAALVCTIGFSVVYSIPGGFDQNNGFPMFLHNNYFIAFVVLDVISFILSTTSIILFLSVTLSRSHEDLEFIIKRWVGGQLLLLSSIIFLVMAFIISFFIIYLKSRWTYVIYAVAYVIMLVYGAVCIAIVTDASRATDVAWFRPVKHRLYRKFSKGQIV